MHMTKKRARQSPLPLKSPLPFGERARVRGTSSKPFERCPKRFPLPFGERGRVRGILWASTLGAIICLVTSFSHAQAPVSTTDEGYGIGSQATNAEIQAWDIDISPTGEGLPAGRGTVRGGSTIYSQKCAGCHGRTGTEGPMDRLVGGMGTLDSRTPIKTVGSYWPYATTLYDYIHRTMPFTAPQSLTPDEVYSLVAWILHQNDIIAKDAVIDAQSLPSVRMPNRDGFVPDPR